MKLLPYQTKAITWARSRRFALIALEQGLGKTVVTAVDLVAPAVVVCPSSMKLTWRAELNKWRPELRVHVVRRAADVIPDCDVVVVNYDILDRVTFPFTAVTLAADESHYAKNYKAKRTKALARLMKTAKRIRCLSGTPIVNRPIELWPLLRAGGATKLSYFDFGMKYCAGWKTPWDTYDFSGASCLDELYEVLDPYMLRLTKEQVLPDLPPKVYRVIELDLPVDKQEKKLDREEIEMSDYRVAFEAIADILKMNALKKLPLALQHIRDALESEPKVVVFAHHFEVVTGLIEGLAEYNPVRVTGRDNQDARFAAVERFQSDPDCRVFVGNLKAAGVGLTLTAAARVIFVECSWTPADIEQAADRCHRIGQTRPVLAEILTIHRSIDAEMLHKALAKLEVISKLVKVTTMSKLNQDIFNQIGGHLVAIGQLLQGLTVEEAAAAPEEKSGAEKTTSSGAGKGGVATAAPTTSETAAPAAAEAIQEAAAEEAAPANDNAEPEVKVTLDVIRELMAKLIADGKRDKAQAILKGIGAAKVSEVKPEQYAEVAKALKAV